MTMLSEYERCTEGWHGPKPAKNPLPPCTEEDVEPVRLEDRRDAPALLQL